MDEYIGRFEKLILPEFLEEIGTSTFSLGGFKGELTIPDTVKVIGDYSFSGNPFTGDIIIPSSTYYIGKHAFEGTAFNGSLIFEMGEIRENTFKILENAFTDSNITKMVFNNLSALPDNGENIPASAFERTGPYRKNNILTEGLIEFKKS